MKEKSNASGLKAPAGQNTGDGNELARAVINDMFAGGFLTEGEDGLLEITTGKGISAVKIESKDNLAESR
jgi:hypothetical protein